MTVDVMLPEAFAGLFKPARYKVYYGGRGSGKSWSIATALVMAAVERPVRILCTRELQASIGDSVKRLLEDVIERLGLGVYFTIQRDEIRGGSGSSFIFEGLRHNVKRIKSLEGIDIVWIEEADAVSNESWNLLEPTIRKKGSEIWMSYNRDLEDDPVHVRFVENERPNSIIKKVLLTDNPWAPSVLKDQAEWDRSTDPERHAHVWLGEPWGRSDAIVFRGRYSVREFLTPPDAIFYVGLDFGFANDPDVALRCFIGEGDATLYIDAEAYGHGIEITETPAFVRSVLPHEGWPIKADSARPELISYLNQAGLNVTSASKGSGSIEAGLRYLLSFRDIVVHPRCKHTAEEFRLYSYKTDPRTGSVLPVLKPGHDHCMDALRYAVEDHWSGSRGRIADYGFDVLRELGL